MSSPSGTAIVSSNGVFILCSNGKAIVSTGSSDCPCPGGPGVCTITPSSNTADLFFEVTGASFRSIIDTYGGCPSIGGTDVMLYADELSALGISQLHWSGTDHQGAFQRFAFPTCPATDPLWYTDPTKYLDTGGLSPSIAYYSGAAFQIASPSLYALGWRCGWLFLAGPNIACPDCSGATPAFGGPTYLYAMWKLEGNSETDGSATFRPTEYFGGDSTLDAITPVIKTGSIYVHS